MLQTNSEVETELAAASTGQTSPLISRYVSQRIFTSPSETHLLWDKKSHRTLQTLWNWPCPQNAKPQRPVQNLSVPMVEAMWMKTAKYSGLGAWFGPLFVPGMVELADGKLGIRVVTISSCWTNPILERECHMKLAHRLRQKLRITHYQRHKQCSSFYWNGETSVLHSQHSQPSDAQIEVRDIWLGKRCVLMCFVYMY